MFFLLQCLGFPGNSQDMDVTEAASFTLLWFWVFLLVGWVGLGLGFFISQLVLSFCQPHIFASFQAVWRFLLWSSKSRSFFQLVYRGRWIWELVRVGLETWDAADNHQNGRALAGMLALFFLQHWKISRRMTWNGITNLYCLLKGF